MWVRAASAAGLALAALSIATASSALPVALPRATADRPDQARRLPDPCDLQPSDGANRALDTDGTIPASVANLEAGCAGRRAAAVYMRATYGSGFLCYDPTRSRAGLQIMDFAVLHEKILHTIGFVPTCAPHNTRAGCRGASTSPTARISLRATWSHWASPSAGRARRLR